MTVEAWAIVAVGCVLAAINIIAASENEKRLDRLANQLQRIADKLHDRR